jgi:hypothetical protein
VANDHVEAEGTQSDEIGGCMNTRRSILRSLPTLAVVLATSLGMDGQKKDKTMEGFRGLVGGVPFENQTSGLTYGVQVEHWW